MISQKESRYNGQVLAYERWWDREIRVHPNFSVSARVIRYYTLHNYILEYFVYPDSGVGLIEHSLTVSTGSMRIKS